MADSKQLDDLISVFYEAVLEPSLWHKAVEGCADYLSGVNAQLSIVSKNQQQPPICVAAGVMMSEQVAMEYAQHYMAIDPHQSLLKGAPVHQWRSNNQTFDKNFISHSAFYQDFLLPQGFHYGLFAVVDETDGDLSTVGITRTAGQKPFDNEDLLTAQRFSPHLQRALRLQKHTQNLQAKATLGALAIDALAIPMLIVDSKQTIMHLNAGAERFLQQNTAGFMCKTGRLSSSIPANRNQLRALIASATHYPAVASGMLLLNGDRTRQVFAIPLPATSAFVKDWQMPLALVLILEPGKNLSTLQLLGSLFDLSPAELRVAAALLAGKSPEHYAHEAQVSLNTVRTQLKSLFRKTGTSRQSELVALLSQLPQLHKAD